MNNDIKKGSFIWNHEKEKQNKKKHQFNFTTALKAFLDKNRIIAIDEKHSASEERFYCIGKVEDKIITVRFTYRKKLIRIIGAGNWRKGVKLYEKENK